jgi:type II secretory pathway component PulF
VLFTGANLLIRALGKESDLLTSPLTEPIVWVFLGPLLIAAFLFFRVGLANPQIKYNWDRFLVHMPFGIGKTVHEFAMSKFGVAMAFLYQGGVPVHKAIQLSADACGNEYIRAQISPASRRLETGAGITDTLRNTAAFSPIVMDMVDTGERTGNMDQMLMRMSSFYEDEGETRAKQIAHIFSVILLVLVALYVLYVLITFYSKLFASYGAAAGE